MNETLEALKEYVEKEAERRIKDMLREGKLKKV